MSHTQLFAGVDEAFAFVHIHAAATFIASKPTVVVTILVCWIFTAPWLV